MRHAALILLILITCSPGHAQQPDSAGARITRQWTLSDDLIEEISVPVDTAFNLFHNYRTSDRYSPFNAYLGNYGLPLYQLNFFDQVWNPDEFLYRHHYPFMHLPVNAVFMNTQVPFSEMVFSYAGPRDRAEQVFKVRHSQNVNRFLNFGLEYDVIYSLGQYSYQRSDDKTFSLTSSYTGPRYKLYTALGINNISNSENGGIADSSQLADFDTRDVEVRLGSLNEAGSILKNRNFLLVQRFIINRNKAIQPDSSLGENDSKTGFRINGILSHILVWEKSRRSYSDNSPLSGFYDTAFINRSVTFDSLSMRVLRNTVRFDFSTDETRKFRLGAGVGIRNELLKYSQIIPEPDTVAADTVSWINSNNVLTGRLFNNIGARFRWIATGELYLSGERAGDLYIDGAITRDFGGESGMARWDIFGNMSSTTPSFWQRRYGSNHFVWDKPLQKEFRINAGTAFNHPGWRFSLRFNYAIIDNFTYFGRNAMPDQHTGGLSIASLTLRKDLSAWKFHLSSDILLQQSSNRDVLDLPAVTVRSAGFFAHNFYFRLTGGNLNTQLGVEVLYHTLYNARSYMPSTGVFYNSPAGRTGNYPYLNAFLNLKIKRTRIFLMLDHFNSGLTGYNYFLVPDYPLNIRLFRYGIAWTFYN